MTNHYDYEGFKRTKKEFNAAKKRKKKNKLARKQRKLLNR